MTRSRKLLEQVLAQGSERAIRFSDLRTLLRGLGFGERMRGSHHIFFRDGVEEILNLQPRSDGSAKPYQVRQVRALLLRYKLGDQSDD